jgi:TolB-like protein/DNA-binding winged helix-turn-helix (wHTH) protein/Flp pilus assembly protein TadD
MDPCAAHGANLRFGVFELDLRSRELRKQGRRMRLQVQPFQVLRVLVEHAGEVVTREALREQVWPSNVYVDFDHGLNNAIARLRDVLGDSAGIPRYIETLPRLGYRFIFPLTTDRDEARPGPTTTSVTPLTSAPPAPIAGEESTPILASAPPALPSPVRRWRPAALRLAAAIALGLAVIAVGGYWRIRQVVDDRAIHSLVVLPFESLSPDPMEEYFVDGVSDALITQLAQLDSLRVISRTTAMHYKGKHLPLAQIARALQVDAVVEGTVVRADPVVRINAQLVRTADDRHLWAQSYERNATEVIALQNEVARAIADAIATEITPKPKKVPTKMQAVKPDALDAYLRAEHLHNQNNGDAVLKSIGFYRAAVSADPTFALGYAGLADAYADAGNNWSPVKTIPHSEAVLNAFPAAQKALDLDPDAAESWLALSEALNLLPRSPSVEEQWERAVLRAMALNPGLARPAYGRYLDYVGRREDSLSQRRLVLRSDPLNPDAYNALAEELIELGRAPEAVDVLRTSVEMDPWIFTTRLRLGAAYMLSKRFAEAIAELRKADEISPGALASGIMLAYTAALAGDAALAETKLRQIQLTVESRGYPDAIALVHIAGHHRDEAMAWMQTALDRRKTHWFDAEWRFPGDDEWLRSDPRYRELADKIRKLPPESGD